MYKIDYIYSVYCGNVYIVCRRQSATMSSTHGHKGVEATRQSTVTPSRRQKVPEAPPRSSTMSSSGQTIRPTSSTIRSSPRVTSGKRAAASGAQNKPDIAVRNIPRSAPIRSQWRQKPPKDVSEIVASPTAAQGDAFKPSSSDLPYEPPDVVEPSTASELREHTAVIDENCVEDTAVGNDDHDDAKVDFQVPDKRDAEQFEASAFLGELRTLSACLQVVLRHQLVDDLEADRLDKMVFTVTATLDNFKAYSACVQKLLETIRDQMKSVADLVYKMVLQPAMIGRGVDSSDHS